MKKAGVIFTLAIIFLALAGLFLVHMNQSPFESKPTVSIDFGTYKNGPLSTADWDFFIGEPVYNEEQQIYTDLAENVSIQNGVLVIQALKKNNKYTSAKVSPKQNGKRMGFQSGKFEIVAKVPSGRGTWPAFWLLSLDSKYTKDLTDQEWEKDPSLWSKNGEIDIMEATGDSPNEVSSDLHTYTMVNEGRDTNVGTVSVPNSATTFHTYGLEWTKDFMKFSLDGAVYNTIEKQYDWPFDQNFYLMLNLAMGGSLGGKIDDTKADGWKLFVKSIKYYPLKSE